MPTYVIERTLPGAGALSGDELRAISQKSNGVLAEMGPRVEWQHSWVTGDKIYCIYEADGEDDVREHGRRGGFPVDSVAAVSARISPATGD